MGKNILEIINQHPLRNTALAHPHISRVFIGANTQRNGLDEIMKEGSLAKESCYVATIHKHKTAFQSPLNLVVEKFYQEGRLPYLNLLDDLIPQPVHQQSSQVNHPVFSNLA